MHGQINTFRALADPTRRELLDALMRGEKTASELSARFSATQQAVSLHLQHLRRTGLVEMRQEGKFRWYRLKAEPIREIYEWALKYKPFFDPSGHAWSFAPASDRRTESKIGLRQRKQRRNDRWQ